MGAERGWLDRAYAKAAGLTHESRVPGTEHRRELVTRYARGELYRALRQLRRDVARTRQSGGDVAAAEERLQRFTEAERRSSRDLDELNRQLNENVTTVEFETPELGRHRSPVITLDLGQPREGERDERVPTVFLGGIATSPYQQLELPASLALAGRRVHCLTYPEHSTAEAPGDWPARLQQDGTYRLHAAALKETIRQMGLERVNLVGLSMGGGIALEAASDEEFCREHVNDLIALEPVGLQEKSWPALAKDFAGKQVIGKTLFNPEAAVKSWRQGDERGGAAGEAMRADIDLLRRQQLTPEKLARIAPAGRYEVWYATKSPMLDAATVRGALLSAETDRRQRAPAASPLEVYEVESKNHAWPLLHAIGLAERLNEAPGGAPVATIKASDLDRSVAAQLLRRTATDSLAS